jgi:hypothetical protein
MKSGCQGFCGGVIITGVMGNVVENAAMGGGKKAAGAQIGGGNRGERGRGYMLTCLRSCEDMRPALVRIPHRRAQSRFLCKALRKNDPPHPLGGSRCAI